MTEKDRWNLGVSDWPGSQSIPVVPAWPLLRNRCLLPSPAEQSHLHLRGSLSPQPWGVMNVSIWRSMQTCHTWCGRKVENNVNNTVSPQGQPPRLGWTQLQLLARKSLFWSNMLLHHYSLWCLWNRPNYWITWQREIWVNKCVSR